MNRENVARWREIPSTVKGDIGEMISAQHALEKYNSRRILLRILGNVRHLARQALPLDLRGDRRASEKSEVDFNFYQLLKLRCTIVFCGNLIFLQMPLFLCFQQ